MAQISAGRSQSSKFIQQFRLCPPQINKGRSTLSTLTPKHHPHPPLSLLSSIPCLLPRLSSTPPGVARPWPPACSRGSPARLRLLALQRRHVQRHCGVAATSHDRNPSRQPKGWPPLFSPGQIDDGVATLVLPQSDRLQDGRPSSPPTRSTTGSTVAVSSLGVENAEAELLRSHRQWPRTTAQGEPPQEAPHNRFTASCAGTVPNTNRKVWCPFFDVPFPSLIGQFKGPFGSAIVSIYYIVIN